MERLCWVRATSPAPFFEQAFEILSPRSHQGLTVDAPKPTQAEPPHPMPVFSFSKQGFDPDTAFAIRLLVGFGGMVGSHSIQIVLIPAAAEGSSLLARRVLCFQRAMIAVFL